MYSVYWQCGPHYDLPACFCSIVSLEGSGFSSCTSVFINFSISAKSGVSDLVAEEAEGGAQTREESDVLGDHRRIQSEICAQGNVTSAC